MGNFDRSRPMRRGAYDCMGYATLYKILPG